MRTSNSVSTVREAAKSLDGPRLRSISVILYPEHWVVIPTLIHATADRRRFTLLTKPNRSKPSCQHRSTENTKTQSPTVLFLCLILLSLSLVCRGFIVSLAIDHFLYVESCGKSIAERVLV